jgi:hypothetical protein
MNEAIETDQAAALMAIVEEVAAGSQGLIRDWQLLPNAQPALRDGGLEGLARFYRDCIERPGAREAWIKATLEAHGRRTLESEYRRFIAVYRSGLGPDGHRRSLDAGPQGCGIRV